MMWIEIGIIFLLLLWVAVAVNNVLQGKNSCNHCSSCSRCSYYDACPQNRSQDVMAAESKADKRENLMQ